MDGEGLDIFLLADVDGDYCLRFPGGCVSDTT